MNATISTTKLRTIRHAGPRRPTRRLILSCLLLLSGNVLAAGQAARPAASPGALLWRQSRPTCVLNLPNEPAVRRVVHSTFEQTIRNDFGIAAPATQAAGETTLRIVIGRPETNETLAQLVRSGLKLTRDDLGDDGYQLVTHESPAAGPPCLVIYARTPRAIKHGLQELIYYHLHATTTQAFVDWPLNLVRKPSWNYRGIYILPCWSAHDSYESWVRVIRFCSELTLNRVWFWLDGFPVAGHPGEYAGTPLADAKNVQQLIDLARSEDMKLLIGGGWFTWHHGKAVGDDPQKGIDYYLQYLDAFHGFGGFYLEPTGEGREKKSWEPEADTLRRLVKITLERQPGFEFALAIGKFNNPQYLHQMAQLDPEHVFWWWCWGDPFRQHALDLYPSVLKWHTVIRMSDFHGTTEPPTPSDAKLHGFATSYDPGQGYGNPWTGWAKLGFDQPRNFHPYTIPYFAHEYFFRERCWQPTLTDDQFAARLHLRLFDADAPPDAGRLYWQLSQFVLAFDTKKPVSSKELAPVRALVHGMTARDWTPRTKDTLSRMKEALDYLPKN